MCSSDLKHPLRKVRLGPQWHPVVTTFEVYFDLLTEGPLRRRPAGGTPRKALAKVGRNGLQLLHRTSRTITQSKPSIETSPVACSNPVRCCIDGSNPCGSASRRANCAVASASP